MKIIITVKTIPESRAEMIHSYGATCRQFKEQFEEGIRQHGVMGIPPHHIETRFLFDSGRWDAAGPDDRGPR